MGIEWDKMRITALYNALCGEKWPVILKELVIRARANTNVTEDRILWTLLSESECIVQINGDNIRFAWNLPTDNNFAERIASYCFGTPNTDNTNRHIYLRSGYNDDGQSENFFIDFSPVPLFGELSYANPYAQAFMAHIQVTPNL